MSSMTSNAGTTTEGALTLHFEDITRVAGETLQGRVDVNIPLARKDGIEQVRIKFLGAIKATITIMTGQAAAVFPQKIVLFHTKTPLWNNGAHPESSSDGILSCPFEFQLPPELPPSFHCQGADSQATVGYSLEVVGERPGMIHFNRRLKRVISIVPAASQNQLLAGESLRQGWNGGWKTFDDEEKLRKGMWGDYAHARVRLNMPDLPSFPISTPVPFSLHVETDTKPLQDHDSDGAVDKHGKPLFPLPPALSSEVQFSLHRWAEVRVKKIGTRVVKKDFKLQGSLGDATCVAAVRHTENAPEWIPDPGHKDEKGRGVWRRSIQFDSAVMLPYAPTFNTEVIECKYELHFTVPFPGIKNDLVLKVPIHLGPGSACPPAPPPLGASGSARTYADVLPAGPPPQMLDLPPTYWAGDHHDWDADEKN